MSEREVNKAAQEVLPLVRRALDFDTRADLQAQDHIDLLLICGESLGKPLPQVIRALQSESKKSSLNPIVVIELDEGQKPLAIHFHAQDWTEQQGRSVGYRVGNLITSVAPEKKAQFCKSGFAEMRKQHKIQDKLPDTRDLWKHKWSIE